MHRLCNQYLILQQARTAKPVQTVLTELTVLQEQMVHRVLMEQMVLQAPMAARVLMEQMAQTVLTEPTVLQAQLVQLVRVEVTVLTAQLVPQAQQVRQVLRAQRVLLAPPESATFQIFCRLPETYYLQRITFITSVAHLQDGNLFSWALEPCGFKTLKLARQLRLA
jgi:hypothetical protein